MMGISNVSSGTGMTTITAPKGAICVRCRRVFTGNELIFSHPWYGTMCTATCSFLSPTALEELRVARGRNQSIVPRLPPMAKARIITAVKAKKAEPTIPKPPVPESMTDILRNEIKKAAVIVRTPVL